MSLSTPAPKFLLDENVRHELLHYLQTKAYDAVSASKGASDKDIAHQSLEQCRILVTNDEDFSWCVESEVFGVIWLHLPQYDAASLLNSFAKLLSECTQFNGKLILLKPNVWETVPLGTKYNI